MSVPRRAVTVSCKLAGYKQSAALPESYLTPLVALSRTLFARTKAIFLELDCFATHTVAACRSVRCVMHMWFYRSDPPR